MVAKLTKSADKKPKPKVEKSNSDKTKNGKNASN